MLKNNSGSADHILLVAEPRTAPVTVTVNASAGQVNLLTPAKSTATALPDLGLHTTGAVDSSTRLKQNIDPKAADLILIPNPNGTGLLRYHYDGTNWKSGARTVADPTAVTIPSGGAFFIRKAPGSNFQSWTLPSE